MYTFFYIFFHVLFLGLLYLAGRSFYFVFTKKDITVSKRILGVNVVSILLSLFVNKFIIGYRLPVLVCGNYKSMALNFIAFSLAYFAFKFLILRKKSWRSEALQTERKWITRGLFTLPTLVLSILGIGFLGYVGFHVAIYMFAAFVAIILLLAIFPWLIIFFI